MRSRLEPFGAWVSPSDDVLLAVDRRLARGLGLDGAALWNDGAEAADRPLEVHVSVGQRCPARCDGCYQSAGPEGALLPEASLRATLEAVASEGAFRVALGGGEPLEHPALAALGAYARSLGLVPVFTTSGLGLTAERARTLAAFAQVNVSHDGVDGGYRAVRGFEAARHAEDALALLRDAGVPAGVNMVLTRESFACVEATAALAVELGARELQLLRYKPAGRAASVDYLARRLAPSQRDALWPLLRTVSERHGGRLSVRIDCALVPLLSDLLPDATLLARLGVWGCEAGRHLAAVDSSAGRSGCSFLSANEPASPSPSAGPCEACDLRPVCRGGCRVVSRHLAGRELGDPECPRVQRFEAARG